MNELDINDSQSTATFQCPICGGSMSLLFEARDYRRPHCRELYRVHWCGPCGYGRIGASLTPEQVAEFYRVDYYTHSAASPETKPRSLLERLRAYAAWRVDRGQDFEPGEVGPPGRIVDIGCGAGSNMAALKAAGFDVVGIEPDAQARTLASRHGPVHEGTAENPPGSVGDGFDYALMSHVLEHTIDPAQALRRARSLLKSSGRMVVEVPNCAATGFWQFGAHWPWTDVPRHIHFFTRNSLTKLLASTGFQVTEARYTGFTRQFQPPWIDALNKIQQELRSADDLDASFRRQGWGFLLKTAWASPDAKYDSIRVHATPM
jgi:SAM-dependent methyltransferase/predicted RNA-binding Zn-ribbon protein involved in translation (DUF1610 family)